MGSERSLKRAGLTPVCSWSTIAETSLTRKRLCGCASMTNGGTYGRMARACSSHAVALMVVKTDAATMLRPEMADSDCASAVQYVLAPWRQARNAGSAVTGVPA